MQRIAFQSTTDIQEKKYWKTYAVCSFFVGTFALINILTSVQNMYSNTSAQEYEFKKVELSENIRVLEAERSNVSNLHNLHAQALENGYTTISQLHYVASPLSQVVAQR